MENICVMGLGYIGLPTASILATKGFQVLGVDVNRETVEGINQGQVHIYEPDLDILVKAAVQSNHLQASLLPKAADVFIIAVPTPFCNGHIPDLSFVKAATTAIAPYLEPSNLVILESTSPVRTSERIAEWLRELRPDLSIPTRVLQKGQDETRIIYLAHCPERVLPGQILRELVENDRIIGGINMASAERARSFYQKFVKGNIYVTDTRTAEMSKLTENAFRDVNIAFANELALICEEMEINIWELISLANRHPRVNILQPGPGVGGHCIAVDPWFIVDSAPRTARLIRIAREVNDDRPKQIALKIQEKASRFKHPIIACLGLSYKQDIDDLRESPSVKIIEQLAQDESNTVLAIEPHIRQLPPNLAMHANVELTDLPYALQCADIIVMLSNHKEFQDVNREMLKEKVVIDTRGVWL